MGLQVLRRQNRPLKQYSPISLRINAIVVQSLFGALSRLCDPEAFVCPELPHAQCRVGGLSTAQLTLRPIESEGKLFATYHAYLLTAAAQR